MPLTAKRQRFVEEFLRDLNATEAAVRAGYGKNDRASARRYASEIRKIPAVRAAIDAGLAERERQLKEHSVRVAEETYTQAVADIGDAFDEDGQLKAVHLMPPEVRRAIASIEVEKRNNGEDVYYVTKIKLHDKRASQELFQKYAGKLKDKVEIEAGSSLEQLIDAALKREP
jgi:phage terminase small subunit